MKILTKENAPEYFRGFIYSCRHCQKWIVMQEESESMYHYCNDKCRFKFIWEILNEYSDGEIKNSLTYKIPNFQLLKYDRTKWQFQLCKILVEETK